MLYLVSLTESETLLALSPSPVPTDTPSPSQTCSELGSRVASPATLEVMSICQNSGTSPAASRPTTPMSGRAVVSSASTASNHGSGVDHSLAYLNVAGDLKDNDPNAASGRNSGLADLVGLGAASGLNGLHVEHADPNGLDAANGWSNGRVEPGGLNGLTGANGWQNGHSDATPGAGNGLSSLAGSTPDLLSPNGHSALSPSIPDDVRVADLLAFADTTATPPLAAKIKTDSLLDGGDTVAALKAANGVLDGVLPDEREAPPPPHPSSSPSGNLLDTSLTF